MELLNKNVLVLVLSISGISVAKYAKKKGASVFIIETLSVIIQVTSFKTTGKRVFKMSPIHHHFELCGWKETKIVYTFWGITFVFCVLALVIRLFMV